MSFIAELSAVVPVTMSYVIHGHSTSPLMSKGRVVVLSLIDPVDREGQS